MKRIYSMVLILCIAFSMVACHSKTPDPTIPPTNPTVEPTDPTTAPTEPTEPEPIVFSQDGPFSRENVPMFMSLFYEKYPLQSPSQTQYSLYPESDCYNDTPPGVFEVTGIQIFSFESAIWRSFLMFDNEIYDLADIHLLMPGFMTNAVPYDYDGDGVKDLMISLYLDTGDYYWNKIIAFNPISKKTIELYSESTFASSAVYITASEDNSQAPITVWRVKWDYVRKSEVIDTEKHLYDYTILSKTYTVTGIAGHLKTVDGNLQFVPYTE